MPYKQRILLSTTIMIGTTFFELCGCQTDIIQQPQSKPQESHTQLKSLYNYYVQFQQDKNRELFLEGINKLRTYYCSGAYEEEVFEQCKQARDYFSTLSATPDSIIIFDIDDTALYGYQKYDELKEIWKYNKSLSGLADDEAPAIQSVLDLYNFLIARGFTIVFLSNRKDTFLSETLDNLIFAGYIPSTASGVLKQLNIIHRSSTENANDDLFGTWKHENRKFLARKYTIVGCIGDHESDFYCPKTHACSDGCCCTGHIVSLPNYLY